MFYLDLFNTTKKPRHGYIYFDSVAGVNLFSYKIKNWPSDSQVTLNLHLILESIDIKNYYNIMPPKDINKNIVLDRLYPTTLSRNDIESGKCRFIILKTHLYHPISQNQQCKACLICGQTDVYWPPTCKICHCNFNYRDACTKECCFNTVLKNCSAYHPKQPKHVFDDIRGSVSDKFYAGQQTTQSPNVSDDDDDMLIAYDGNIDVAW